MQENRKLLFDDLFDIFSMLIGGNYVTLCDIKSRVTRYSSAIVEKIGLPGEYISDDDHNWSDYIHPEDRSKHENAMSEILAMRQHTYDVTYRVRMSDGTYRMFRFVGGMIRDADGHPGFAGGMMIQSGQMEYTDRVTSMRNLQGFLEDLKEYEGQDISFLLTGFGRLSHINEVYGYGYGSRLLRAVGKEIQSIVKDEGKVYRMEGSKFAILSTKLSSDEMGELYGRIYSRLKQGVRTDGITHNLVTYGGIMTLASGGHPDRTLYDCLLHACAESRQYHHGELVAYNGNRTEEPAISDSIAVIRAVRESLDSDFEGFYLMYRPMFSKSRSRLIGADVLVRWKHERFGEIPPGVFFAEIEQDKSFEKLSYWILKKAMLDGREFLAADSDFVLHLTVMPSLMNDPYFIDNVAELAKEVRFPLSHLSAEITKECRMLPVGQIREFADALRDKKIHIGLDQFGRGNAWLKNFSEVRPDHVRFSEELTDNLTRSENDRTIFRHLVRMTDACGADVCITGIDSDEKADFFANLPVYGMQGTLLSGAIYYDEVLEYYDTEDSDNQ